MRELAGWELLLGGAVIVWVLWRFGRGSVKSLSRDQTDEDTGPAKADEEKPSNDWLGLLLPLIAVFGFVLLLIYSLRG